MKKLIFMLVIAMATIGSIVVIHNNKQIEKGFSVENAKIIHTETEEKYDDKGFAEVETQEETSETTIQAEPTVPKEKIEEYQVDNSASEKQTNTTTKDEIVSDNSTIVSVSPTTESNADIPEIEDNKQTVEEEISTEVVDKPNEDDTEYQTLLSQVEYATYEECLNAGFDIAFSDTVNILGFDPVEIIYKGQVIGYKLKIRYTNPLEN